MLKEPTLFKKSDSAPVTCYMYYGYATQKVYDLLTQSLPFVLKKGILYT
jgi:hypothetical protein